MTLVTAVGKQPSSDVWVLGPTIQINKDGELISKERQLFFGKHCNNTCIGISSQVISSVHTITTSIMT